ncbi:hypothetical protein ABS755_07240 [Castellaniella sp. FW104-16D08]|uniref:hypothetical protein n=1 Tax=unclassified Castellaniella TaxID=2617606 RepID=UPI00331488EE
MASQDTERITLSMEQFDDTLKKWKRKGADRTLAFVFFASIPLAIIGGLLPDLSPLQVVLGSAIYYCGVAGLAQMTQ